MPFPLAHPAAVMPLRRYGRGWFNFPALVVGSLVPDAAYIFPNLGVFSHQVLGSVEFGLPVGGAILAAFYLFRTAAAERMPAPLRRSLLPLCRRPVGPIWIAVLSLLIGISTHLLWDSFTHTDGWFVEQIPFLLTPVGLFAGRTVRLCNLLWYASSVVGMGWLFFEFEKWKRNGETGTSTVVDALFLAILVVPISLVHHLIRSPIGLVATGVLCIFLAMLFLVKMSVSSQNQT
jgi:Domain of unknown function (DUF4184)